MATIKELPKTKCKDCGEDFRYYPGNSTIKPIRCMKCENTRAYNKQKEQSRKRIEDNKRLLSQANFNNRNYKSKHQANKYTVKKKNGKKRLKTPRERFYESTAWKWFSRYILLYYSVDGTVVQCSTCSTFKTVNDREMHTGHWIKVFDSNSTNYATAYEFTNLGPQCSKCNRHMGGRERLMAEWLKEQHGQEELDRLQLLSKQIKRLDDYTLDQIAKEYREKFNQLLKERGWKNPWKK